MTSNDAARVIDRLKARARTLSRSEVDALDDLAMKAPADIDRNPQAAISRDDFDALDDGLRALMAQRARHVLAGVYTPESIEDIALIMYGIGQQLVEAVAGRTTLAPDDYELLTAEWRTVIGDPFADA